MALDPSHPETNKYGKVVGDFSSLLHRSYSPGTSSLVSSTHDYAPRMGIPQSATPVTFSQRCHRFWKANTGIFYVILSQFCGAIMSTAATLLETEGNGGKGFHPLHLLVVRMSVAVLFTTVYMIYYKTPGFPLGPKEVRWLLALRGFSGFFGIWGLYYSLIYLPMADAMVITYLCPGIACALGAYFLKQPFTRAEQYASLISLIGVVLIARPAALFAVFNSPPPHSTPIELSPSSLLSNVTAPATSLKMARIVTQSQKVMAVGYALIGVCGGSIVIVLLRAIGSRAHPLLTVQYFAVWTGIVSGIACIIIPNVGFQIPTNPKDIFLLAVVSIFGLTTQAFYAKGISLEKSSRATNMIYTNMVFALAFDKLVFGHNPEMLSIIGSSLILGPAIYVALMKQTVESEKSQVPLDEEMGLISRRRGSDASQFTDFDSDDISLRDQEK